MFIPSAAGQGVASMLCDALEKLAGGRGAKSLTVDASDNAEGFFVKRGYVAKQRNTVTVNGEWLANTTMQKSLTSDAPKGATAMSRERLYLFDTTLRDGAQTNGVDFTLHDKRLIAEMLDDLGIDYVEGGYPGANPTDTEFFSQKPKLDHASFHRIRHDAPSRPLCLERSGARRTAGGQGRRDLLRGKILGVSGARRAGDHQRGKPRLDPRQR